MLRKSLLLLLVAFLAPIGVAERNAGACSLPMPYGTFTGEMAAKAGNEATFHVREFSQYKGSKEAPDAIQPGSDVNVTYGDGDEKFLHEGTLYRVEVWKVRSIGFYSGVPTAEDVCGGGGTRHADESTIDTGLYTRDGSGHGPASSRSRPSLCSWRARWPFPVGYACAVCVGCEVRAGTATSTRCDRAGSFDI